MQNDRILSSLSLAQKAGKVASGEFAVEKAVKGGLAWLVIVASDASDNTKKKMRNMTTFYEVPLYIHASKDDLGGCIGKEYRSMVAVLDQGFAKSMESKLKLLQTTE